MDKKPREPIVAKKCYGHLGGKLGGLLFARMLELGWFKPQEGKNTVYEITEKGYAGLAQLGGAKPQARNKVTRGIQPGMSQRC